MWNLLMMILGRVIHLSFLQSDLLLMGRIGFALAPLLNGLVHVLASFGHLLWSPLGCPKIRAAFLVLSFICIDLPLIGHPLFFFFFKLRYFHFFLFFFFFLGFMLLFCVWVFFFFCCFFYFFFFWVFFFY